MKRISVIALFLALLSSCTQVDFCETRHPHSDKVVVDLNWANFAKGVVRPSEMTLYAWNESGLYEKQYKSTAEDQFVSDLPPAGKYKMMLISSPVDAELKNTGKYETISVSGNFQLPDGDVKSTYGPESLVVVPLGEVQIIGNTAVFVNGFVRQSVRPVEVKISLNNSAFLYEKAFLGMSGHGLELNLSKNEASNSTVQFSDFPIELGASSMRSMFTMFGSIKDQKQLLRLDLYPKTGLQQSLTIDISQYIQKFELSNPNKNVKLTILIDGQTFSTADGTRFEITMMSIDGVVVDRGGII